MSEQSIIVWDLETVPDLAAGRMLNMGDAPEADVRQALGSGFPKHPLHKIVCVGGLIASRQNEGWRIDALCAPHIGERTEAELISAFVEKVGELRPQLITFNGHSFDLPVLRYRAMVNRVLAAGLQSYASGAKVTDEIFKKAKEMIYTVSKGDLTRDNIRTIATTENIIKLLQKP